MREMREIMKPMTRVSMRAQGLKIPYIAHFDLTYRCHQRCLHCYLPADWRQGKGAGPELETGRVKRILEQLAAAGTFFLTFSGGEIFLRPDLLEILEHARRLNFCITLMSSGTWGLNRVELELLSDLGIGGLIMTLFSLDADTHDRITGMTGSWKLLQQTINTGKALGVPVVLNWIGLRPNYSGLRAVREFTAKEGIPLRCDTELTRCWDGQPHLLDLELKHEEKARILDELSDADEENQNPGKAVADPLACPPGGCGAGWDRSYITPQGEVWPCVDVPWPCGHLNKNTDFISLWQGTAFEQVRRILDKADDFGTPLCNVYQRNIYQKN